MMRRPMTQEPQKPQERPEERGGLLAAIRRLLAGAFEPDEDDRPNPAFQYQSRHAPRDTMLPDSATENPDEEAQEHQGGLRALLRRLLQYEPQRRDTTGGRNRY